MKNNVIKLSVLSIIILVGMMGIWIWMQIPRVEQPMSQVSEEDKLEEAERLTQQVVQLYQQAKYAEAIPLAEKALKIGKNVLGNNHPDVATILNNLAALYKYQGRYMEAEPLYQQSLVIDKEKLGNNHPNVATSLNNLAALYSSQGKYTKAEPLYQQSLVIIKEKLGDNHPDVAQSLNNLAALYKNQGRYKEAEVLMQESLAIDKKKSGDNHPDVVATLNNLGLFYESRGRYKEAEPLYQESLAIRKEKLGDNHPDVAGSLNNLARLYFLQGRYTKAEPLYQKSLAIIKEKLGNNHPYVAGSLNNLAGLYSSQGRYTEAEPLYQQSLAIIKEKLGDNYLLKATSLNNLAELYRSQERYKKATPLMQNSLAIWKEKLGGNHQNVAESLNNLSELYSLEGNTTRAMKLLSQGLAVEEYNISENLIAGNERQKWDYMRTISGTTNIAISFNLQFAPNNSEATRLAIKTIFERKGRILDVLTNRLQILRHRSDDPETQELLSQLMAKRTQLSNLVFKKPEDFPSLEVYRQLLSNVKKEVKELGSNLRRRSTEFRNLSQSINLKKIQQQIPANTTLVELIRYEPFNPKASKDKRFGKPRYAAYILYKTGKPQAIDLGAAEPIDKTVGKLRTYLRNSNVSLEQLKRSARELDQMVMEPVRQLLGDTKTLLLSPDAALNLLPFEVLVDENNQYLVENYQITYLTSGRDLLQQKPKNNRQIPLIMANPKYEEHGEVDLDNYPSIGLSDQVFPLLGGTQQEAETMGQLFPEALILTKTTATENALKQIKNPNFLHIATHGFFLSKPTSENSTDIYNPLFLSGLVFARVEQQHSEGDDGIFTAYEATFLNLVGTQLVVLSAYDTGKGNISAWEGIYGLRRAFVIAESESQMISLWKVGDNATKDLMAAYYQRLKAGKGRRDALLEIQRDWLKGEKYQHPYYWGSFVFSGDGTPMEFSY
ncbi:MAG: tetratricopeptide repeat protein [Trichodesmium sp. MAG_R04]|nr:tetratricopeptide repeat protein [Trichodesmium sp. MAG_R04]